MEGTPPNPTRLCMGDAPAKAVYRTGVHTEAAHLTDVGLVRDHNEDFALVDESLGLYVVCDGMGGHAAGEVASELCAHTVQQTVQHAAGVDGMDAVLTPEESLRVEQVLRSALENANAQVHELGVQDPAKYGAGTTCTAMLIRKSRGFLAHVGDSRAYLKRNGRVHQISTDHSALEAAMRRGMPKEEAEATFGSNMLLRAIGPGEQVVVDTLAFDVLPGDTFLLCSDGLCGYVESDEELEPYLDEELARVTASLIALANERGGGDNITAVALRILSDSAEPDSEVERHSRLVEDLAALSCMQLFSEMAYPELLEIAEVLQDESYEADQEIVTEGDTSDSLYVISSGTLLVERGDQVIATLDPGCHFGEMALLTNRPRTATVRATGPTRLLALTRPAIYGLFEQRPAIGMKFLWTLAQVQSLRLDEALLWRTPAESRDTEQSAEAGADEGSASPNEAGEQEVSFGETLQGFPAPLSRRVV
jgi:serine/threonine protein phosphatase PrpC/CRP-like cAMP-binding protein